jgi:hypothetical protein
MEHQTFDTTLLWQRRLPSGVRQNEQQPKRGTESEDRDSPADSSALVQKSKGRCYRLPFKALSDCISSS